MRRIKVAMLSDSATQNTGYATITRNLLNELTKRGFQCVEFAHSYVGSDLMPPIKFADGTGIDFQIVGNGARQFYEDVIEDRLQRFRPDVFIILLDTFMCYPWLLGKNLAPAKSIFYFPHDGGGQLPQNCENILRKVSLPVAMAKYGQIEASKYGIKAEYIPHAVHHNLYVPFKKEDKKALKKQHGFQNKFVVGSVLRNQPRKMLDKTFQIFQKFAQGKDDVALLLHTDPVDVAQAFDCNLYADRLKIGHKVFYTGMRYFNGFDYRIMPQVYNTFDAFILTTSGEGFGVPIIEAMACGVPTLVTGATTTQELVLDNKAGLGIDVAETVLGSWHVDRFICSCEDGVKKLEQMYKSWKEFEAGKQNTEYEQWSINGRKAVERDYTWDKVVDKWVQVIENLAGFKNTLDDEYYFANRNLEPKHLIDALDWKEFFKCNTAFEFGCGKGIRVFSMNKAGIAAYGSEFSQYAVDNTFATGKVFQEDITNPKEGIEKKDLVVAYDVLEHIPYEKLDKAIEAIKNRSKKHILISLPVIGDPNLENDPTHIVKETKEWWEKKFESFGLKKIEVPKHFLFREQLFIYEVNHE